MSEKTEELKYQSREALDGELVGAVGEILSAEAEARKIIEQAEASGKAVRLDGAARERTLRDTSERECAAERERVIAEARKRADDECKRLIDKARLDGEKLVKSKQADIKKRAAELADGVGLLGE